MLEEPPTKNGTRYQVKPLPIYQFDKQDGAQQHGRRVYNKQRIVRHILKLPKIVSLIGGLEKVGILAQFCDLRCPAILYVMAIIARKTLTT
jgi:hypothetical protein